MDLISRACPPVTGGDADDGGGGRAPSSQPPRRRWGFSGLISGAGRLIRSILEPSSSSSDDDDDDDDMSLSSDENKDNDAFCNNAVNLNQSGRRSEVVKDKMKGPQAVVAQANSKQGIAQLLMQQTFSRDECDRLTKIIQSRVVDLPSAEAGGRSVQNKLPNVAYSKTFGVQEAPWSSDHAQNTPEKIPYCSQNLSPFSPGSWRAHSLDLCNTAIMEAKKWLEEKKSASSSKSDFTSRPFMPVADVSRYHIDGEMGSPVEMAKSYMRSLPPWHSPSLSNTGYKSTLSSKYHFYNDESPYTTANTYLSSSKVQKRSYLEFESHDSLDEIRRVRPRSIERKPNQLLEFSSTIDERGVDAIGTNHDSGSLPAAAYTALSLEVSTKSSDEDRCSDKAPILQFGTVVEANQPIDSSNSASVDMILDGEKDANAVRPTHGNLTLAYLHVESNSGERVEGLSCEPAGTLCEKLDVEQPLQDKNPVDAFVSSDTAIVAPSYAKHDGETIGFQVGFEQTIMPESKSKSIQSLGKGETVQPEGSLQLNLVPDLNECDPIFDHRSLEGTGQIQKETNGSTSINPVNCSTIRQRIIEVVEGERHNNSINSHNGETAEVGISEGMHEAAIHDPLETKCSSINSSNGVIAEQDIAEGTRDVATNDPPEIKCSSTNSGNGKLGELGISEGTHEFVTHDPVKTKHGSVNSDTGDTAEPGISRETCDAMMHDPPLETTKSYRGKSRNNTTMRAMLAEVESSTSQPQGRKPAVRARRGRSRARGGGD